MHPFSCDCSLCRGYEEPEPRCPTCGWYIEECRDEEECKWNRQQNAKWKQERADRMGAMEEAAGRRVQFLLGVNWESEAANDERPIPEREEN